MDCDVRLVPAFKSVLASCCGHGSVDSSVDSAVGSMAVAAVSLSVTVTVTVSGMILDKGSAIVTAVGPSTLSSGGLWA